MMDVQNLLLQDELSFVLGQKIQPHVALEVRILEALDKAFGLDVDDRFYRIWDRLNRAQYLWSRTPNPEPEGKDLDRPLNPLPDPGLQAMTSLARSLEPALVQQGKGPRDLTELEARLSTLPDRDDVARAVAGFLSRRFHRVVLFRVSRGQVAGWLASGRDVDAAALTEFRLGFEQPSLFVNLKEGTDHYRGPLLPMPAHRAVARIWGGSLPRECLLLPIRVRGRLVTVIYADRRNEGLGISIWTSSTGSLPRPDWRSSFASCEPRSGKTSRHFPTTSDPQSPWSAWPRRGQSAPWGLAWGSAPPRRLPPARHRAP